MIKDATCGSNVLCYTVNTSEKSTSFTHQVLIATAAIVRDTVNYWIGHRVGSRAYSGEVRWIKQELSWTKTP